jgi:hypothetical protein
MKWLGALVGCVLALAEVGGAHAQQARPLAGDGIQVVNRRGEYGGVQPGVESGAKNGERKPAARPRRKNIITWVGFQPQADGGSRVFLQLTSEVPFTQSISRGRLVIRLRGARLGNSNATRFLDTRFFDTALARVDADRRRRGVEVVIEFKSPADLAEGSASMTTSQVDGYTYLFIEFPPPSAGAAAPAGGDDEDVDVGDDVE